MDKFCNDMETTPVGVIVGLFQAISQKLPAFTDWETQKHHHLLNSNPDVCSTMSEVRQHVTQFGMLPLIFSSGSLVFFSLTTSPQRATFGAVAARHSTVVTSTVYPTNSFPDLLFEPTKRHETKKRKKKKKHISLDERSKFHYTCFYLLLSMRS